MKTLFRRQLATVLSVVLISFVLLSAAFMAMSYRHIIQEKKMTLGRNARYIAQFTGDYLKQGGSVRDDDFRLYVASVAQIAGARIILCETDGQIVYATDGARIYNYEQTVPRSVLDQVTTRGRYSGMSDLGGIFTSTQFVTAVPVTAANGTIQTVRGVVIVTTGAAAIAMLWRSMLRIFLATVVVALVIAVIVGSITSARMVRPLNAMTDAARQFGRGDFSARICGYEQRRDELGALAEAFNNMADSIEQSETRRNEFIANVSHELKTPMTTIAGFAEGILDGTIPPERERESLQVISDETRRLSRLVRRMLDLSRLQAQGQGLAAREQFDVCEVMLRVLVSLEGRITGNGLDVQTELPEEKLMVVGDPDAVTQVCYNLLDNAAKFATPGSAITVGIAARDDKAWVTVSNEGATIPPEELPLLFERFHKADHSRSQDRDGVGLGLYIVKTILNNMSQDVTAESQDGVTKFTFTLALA